MFEWFANITGKTRRERRAAAMNALACPDCGTLPPETVQRSSYNPFGQYIGYQSAFDPYSEDDVSVWKRIHSSKCGGLNEKA